MTHHDTDTTVSEYLADVTARVSDLPVLQRRELLADLEAHIAAERIERNAETHGQLLDILARLGTPEEIAAAAHAEAPPTAPRPPDAAPAARRPLVTAPAVVAVVALLLITVVACAALFLTSANSSSEPEPVLPDPGQSAQAPPREGPPPPPGQGTPPTPQESAPR